MTFSPLSRQSFSKRAIAFLSILLLSFSLWSCNGDKDTAQADVNVDPEIEAQVLEIIRKNPKVIIDAVQEYQRSQQQAQQQQQQQVAEDFKQKLLSDPKSIIGTSPVIGSDAYKVVMIEFSDFECPFCARAHGTINTFIEQHKDTVTLAYKHLPLIQIHEQAFPAATASWAAQQQGKFWEYHNKLFENQGQLGEELYQQIAQDLGLDLKKFAGDRQAAEAPVQADLTLAEQLGIRGTPFFVLASTETGKFETFSGALSLQEYEAKLTAVTTP